MLKKLIFVIALGFIALALSACGGGGGSGGKVAVTPPPSTNPDPTNPVNPDPTDPGEGDGSGDGGEEEGGGGEPEDPVCADVQRYYLVTNAASWTSALNAINTLNASHSSVRGLCEYVIDIENHSFDVPGGTSSNASPSSNDPNPMLSTAGAHVTLKGSGTIGIDTAHIGGGTILGLQNETRLTLEGPTLDSSGSSFGYPLFVWGAAFTLQNGKIANGSAVIITNDGSLTMNGGEISGTRVSLVDGTLTMNGGSITGNSDHGVDISPDATFTMNGGFISNNTAANPQGAFSNRGGGVLVRGTFTMNGGEISGNSATSAGGGVYVASGGTFLMEGGVIRGNRAGAPASSGTGAGVAIANGTFIKTGNSVIYGSNESSEENKNTCVSYTCHGAAVAYNTDYLPDTVGANYDIDTTLTPPKGFEK